MVVCSQLLWFGALFLVQFENLIACLALSWFLVWQRSCLWLGYQGVGFAIKSVAFLGWNWSFILDGYVEPEGAVSAWTCYLSAPDSRQNRSSHPFQDLRFRCSPSHLCATKQTSQAAFHTSVWGRVGSMSHLTFLPFHSSTDGGQRGFYPSVLCSCPL